MCALRHSIFDIFLIDTIHTKILHESNDSYWEWCMGYGFIRIIYFSICILHRLNWFISHIANTEHRTNIQYSTLPNSQTNRREIDDNQVSTYALDMHFVNVNCVLCMYACCSHCSLISMIYISCLICCSIRR